ncbi:hypothetical protein BD309DRAFT_959100 [Dichomitus squalens]|nr:hypothetical protein BD309DRAFT_959100 [Dichomitus squalens]
MNRSSRRRHLLPVLEVLRTNIASNASSPDPVIRAGRGPSPGRSCANRAVSCHWVFLHLPILPPRRHVVRLFYQIEQTQSRPSPCPGLSSHIPCAPSQWRCSSSLKPVPSILVAVHRHFKCNCHEGNFQDTVACLYAFSPHSARSLLLKGPERGLCAHDRNSV